MIPKLIHVVFGLEENFGGRPFSFAHWAAIKSAIKHNPDYRVIFWHKFLPQCYYFDDVRDEIELQNSDPPGDIFGNPLVHVAHKADVMRLRVLIEYGGIYMDLDTIVNASFDSILDNKFVMGVEEIDKQRIGLCNAFMAGEPNSAFALAWLETYQSFRSKGRDQYWNEHSVVVPSRLAEQMPSDITIFPHTAFFYPDWSRPGLEKMFQEVHDFPEAISHHLWESFSWNALRRINEFNVMYLSSSYANLIQRDIYKAVGALQNRRKKWAADQLQAKTARINLGSGVNFDVAMINCDSHPQSGADFTFNVLTDSWPLPDSSVIYVQLHNVMTHLSGDLQHFFAELYRVTRSGAIIDIRVPHPRHDSFLVDHTNCRIWHQDSFDCLDRQRCLDWYFSGDPRPPLALYWNVDFQLIEKTLFTADQSISEKLSEALGGQPFLEKAIPFLNNIIYEISVKLQTRKHNQIAPH